ncbi:MAG: methyltransferase domain-containing protein [Nocardioides sp.]
MSTYALGSQDPELARLEQQAEFLETPTRVLLSLCGITPGMRVLDLGSGLGHVARAVADLVGPEGEVVGLDADERMVEEATRRTDDPRVRFVTGDALSWRDGRPFDAVVGRLILFHLPDPANVVRHHLDGVRPGGRVVVLDYDIGTIRSDPTEPLTTWLGAVLVEAFRRVGTDPTIGSRLQGILADGGVSDVQGLGIEPYVAAGSPIGPAMLGGVIRTLAPAIVAHGLATADELDVDKLPSRIAEALDASGSVLVPPALAGAWGRRA